MATNLITLIKNSDLWIWINIRWIYLNSQESSECYFSFKEWLVEVEEVEIVKELEYFYLRLLFLDSYFVKMIFIEDKKFISQKRFCSVQFLSKVFIDIL